MLLADQVAVRVALDPDVGVARFGELAHLPVRLALADQHPVRALVHPARAGELDEVLPGVVLVVERAPAAGGLVLPGFGRPAVQVRQRRLRRTDLVADLELAAVVQLALVPDEVAGHVHVDERLVAGLVPHTATVAAGTGRLQRWIWYCGSFAMCEV